LHRPIIETSDVCFAYHDGKPVLTGISLSILHEDSVGFIGPNGAGKSTLLMCFNGLLKPTSGTVRVDGLPVVEANLKEVRRKVGWMAQDSNDQLFMPTLFEDVAFGPLNLGLAREEVLSRVEDAFRQVGLSGFADRAPSHLSGGERKAAAIATVLSMRPEILLLDEPTNDLDHASRRALIDLLKRLPVTRVVASHDLEMILELCRRVILFDQGRIVAEGPTAEVLGNETLLRAHRLESPLSLALRR